MQIFSLEIFIIIETSVIKISRELSQACGAAAVSHLLSEEQTYAPDVFNIKNVRSLVNVVLYSFDINCNIHFNGQT